MEAAVCDAAMDLSVLAAEYLGIRSRNRTPNRSAAIVPRLPDFVLHQVLSAVLRPWVGPLATRMRHADWQRGYCPVCGSLPSISCLSKAGELSSEFLVGGGGRRFLHCSLCGLDWPVHRNFCAVCEREETAMKCYLSVKDEAAERVDICNHCNHYLPCIDLREFEAFFHLDTAAVGMAHMDLLAQEKGFSPMVRMPWNTFQ
jgi:FdhE protein